MTLLAAAFLQTDSFRNHLLLLLSNPDVAVLLLLSGLLFITLEAHTPGTILPGALGVLCVLLAVFGLAAHPVRPAAVLLLGIAVALILLEVKLAGHGLLATPGALALVIGLRLLVIGPDDLRVHTATALSAGISFAAITFFVAWLSLKARHNKSLTGPEAMLGLVAIVRSPLAPSGQVEVRGELWQATLPQGSAAAGDRVEITAVHGLALTVRPIV